MAYLQPLLGDLYPHFIGRANRRAISPCLYRLMTVMQALPAVDRRKIVQNARMRERV
jgi:hypothetical protein